jgi:hypothetical protein
MKSDPKQNETTMKILWNEEEIWFVTIPIMESSDCWLNLVHVSDTLTNSMVNFEGPLHWSTSEAYRIEEVLDKMEKLVTLLKNKTPTLCKQYNTYLWKDLLGFSKCISKASHQV